MPTELAAPAPGFAACAASLAEMSRQLGAPELDAAILGEGNTSMRVDAATFLVKSSGSNLMTLVAGDLSHLRFADILPLLDGEADVPETALAAAYQTAKIDPAHAKRPSVETVFHAALLHDLGDAGVNVIAHTHPTGINMLTCARNWRDVLAGRLFPDEVVVLGEHSVFVPYVDPGVALARRIRAEVAAYRRAHVEPPRTIYMQNHGFIALARSPLEALNITRMAIKAARIRLGALQAGGFATLGDAVAAHLKNRPDERYREQVLARR